MPPARRVPDCRIGKADSAAAINGAKAEELVAVAVELGENATPDELARIGHDVDLTTSLARLLDRRTPIEHLIEAATTRRDATTGKIVGYSPKVFIDLTRLCRDRCHYCTFVRTPIASRIAVRDAGGHELAVEPSPYLSPERVVEVAAAGAAAGCGEALFTLGDRPEDRYESARTFLRKRSLDSTAQYVVECAQLVIDETGLLPHINPGVMTEAEIEAYRQVSVSLGLMLESTSRDLYEVPGECHFASPDKDPAVRLESIDQAGRQRVPFTTGLLVGIGETGEDRVATLGAIAASARRHGHIQEVIVQNFRAKSTIPMKNHPEPELEEVLRVVALARILMPEETAIQAPPNLMPGALASLLAGGVSDWGGISPVTADHVNPEAPWPEIEALESESADAGFELRARLAIHARFVREGGWLDPAMVPAVDAMRDADGWAALTGLAGAGSKRADRGEDG